jgi:hypothetical protein
MTNCGAGMPLREVTFLADFERRFSFVVNRAPVSYGGVILQLRRARDA